MNKVNTNIKFTKDEEDLLGMIKNVINKYTPNTTARLCGGFVRDKLLGKESHDIDIMLDNISGDKFANFMAREYDGKEHVIESNPNASKHLETAGLAVTVPSGKKIDLDFAMAREEVYHDNSRIPDIKLATPQDDAFRRDLTINSIFYNINSGIVEDFTGNGIKDLITNTIRTPCDPNKTFRDDPLRIFRTLRFLSRFNGTLDKDTLGAMKNPNLINDIKNKVSKERISEELFKTFSGPNSVVAIKLLKEIGVFDAIIQESLLKTKYEKELSNLDMNQNNPHHTLTVWDHTVQVIINVLNKYEDSDPYEKVIITLSALMHDLGKLYSKIQSTENGKTSYKGHANESKEISMYILKFLKFETNIIKDVSKMIERHMDIHNFINSNQTSIKTLRKFLRTTGEQSINWIDLFNHALADALAKSTVIDENTINKYNELKSKIEEALSTMNNNSSKVEPILDGNEIMRILNIKPGMWMKEITEFIKDLQDSNPNITKEEASSLIKEKFSNIQKTKERVK